MSLRDCLELYNTDKEEDNELLNRICRNVSVDYYPSANNKNLIKKITEAFSNTDLILSRFEEENENILDEIKKYILGCKLDDETTSIINDIMKKWAIYFTSIGVLPEIKPFLIARYRQEYVQKYFKQEKCEFPQTEYLKYLFFVKKMWEGDKGRQIEILEKYRSSNNRMLDWMIEYISKSNNENRLSKDAAMVISEEYIENLKDERFLLKTVNDIYDEIFRKDSYENYIDDLNKIYLIQENIDNWVDTNKLNSLITDCNLNLLKCAHLVDEVNLGYKKIIRLTEIGISIVTGRIVEKWLGDVYFIDLKSVVLIPRNCNPLIIAKYILDRNYILKGIDFLITLERKAIAND